MDFTCTNQEFELNKKLLSEITQLITKRTGIPLYIKEISKLQFNNKLTGYKAIIKFWGADHPRNQAPPPHERWTTSIKIEIILYEKMIFPVQNKEIHHAYSDSLSKKSLMIPCYSISEVLAEKLRALIQRSYTAPRDFYDIWYLSNNVSDIDWKAVTKAFHQKMKFKNIVFKGIEQMMNPENDDHLKAAWKNSLAHQIPEEVLPDYEIVKSELLKLFNYIFDE